MGFEGHRSEYTGLIALHCRLAEMEGYTLQKKKKRFTQMYDYIDKHLAKDFNVSSIGEAVLLSAKDDVGETGHDNLEDMLDAYKWMEDCCSENPSG